MPVRGENSLFFATGLDNSGLERGISEASGLVAGLGKTISAINPFAALAIGALAAFAEIASSAFVLARDFETAMKEVATISGAARADFEGLSREVFALSEITPEEPKALAEAYYQIVSAGYDGADGMKLLETASKSAIAGVTDTQTAADGITTIMNAFGVAIEDVDKVADSMFTTVELGKTTFDQIASTISQVAPLASSVGVGFDEILAAVASLTKQGVPTAQAMTQIRASLIGVNEILGDGWANAYTFQDALIEVEKQSGGSQNELTKLLGRVEAVGAVLATTGKNAEGAASDLSKLSKSAGAVERAFQIQISSNTNQWKLFSNQIKNATSSLGEFVLSASTGLAKTLNNLTKNYNSVSESMAKQSSRLLTLRAELLETNTTSERRLEIIAQLKSISPDYLGLLKLEEMANNELASAIEKANDKLVDQIVIRKQQEEIEETANDAAESKLELLDKERFLREKIAFAEKKFGIDVDRTKGIIDQTLETEIQLRKVTGEKQNLATLYANEFKVQLGILTDLKSEFEGLNQEVGDLEKKKLDLQIQLGLVQETKVDEKISEELRKKLETIQSINKESDLTPFLNDGNKQIEAAAQGRLELIKKSRSEEEEEFKKFVERLKNKKEAYKDYESIVETLGEKGAKKFRKDLGLNEESFGEYLSNLLENTRSTAKQIEILLIGASEGVVISRTPEKKAETIKEGVKQNIDVSIRVDEGSIEDAERVISYLNELYEKAGDQQTRIAIKARKEEYEAKLKIMRGEKDDEVSTKNDLYNSISELRTKDIRDRLSAHKNLLAELMKDEKKNAEQIADLQRDISAEEEEMANRAMQIGRDVGQIFGDLSRLFSTFGNDDLSELMGQLQGVAEGAGQLAAGLAQGGNPLDIIAGATKILSSAITVEIVSDTAKFEKAIKELERSVSQLDYAISQSLGNDKISNRKEAIDQLKELEEQAKLAEEAEARARKETKFLGITIGKKGEGSGTDPEKIRELEDQAEQARREVEALNKELNEIFTGTTSSSIVDALVEGFREGRRSAQDFASDFEDLMKNAVIESLKVKFLEKAANQFFEDFANAAESDGGLSIEEINSLRSQFGVLVDKSNAELEALNSILEGAGIEGGIASGSVERQGLAGQISTITEDTANVLAGTLNGIRLDVNNGLAVAQSSNLYLSMINLNIARLVEETEISNIRLTSIERNLQ